METARHQERYRKSRYFWFGFVAISIATIIGFSVFAASRIGGFLEARLLGQDARISMQFANSIVQVQQASDYFHGESMNPSAPEMEAFLRHVAQLPDILRANVYGQDRTVLWSSSPAMIGQRFTTNAELELAFQGQLSREIKSHRVGAKEEHVDFPPGVTEFIEHYLPIWHPETQRVIGVVEIYKNPETLLMAIRKAQALVWIGTLGGAAFLVVALTVVAAYARRVLRAQEAENIEIERLAVIGEMTSAVAHGLRNPLAAIRSCAELALDDELTPMSRQSIRDIVSQSERLEDWIRSFLRHSANETTPGNGPTAVDAVIADCLEGFAIQLRARSIRVEFSPTEPSPLVKASADELSQVLNSILSNSIEAIQRDGLLCISRADAHQGMVCVRIEDSGPGIDKNMLAHAFDPFETTKASGMGVGLSLARRIIDRLGGTVELANAQKKGAAVTIFIPGVGQSNV